MRRRSTAARRRFLEPPSRHLERLAPRVDASSLERASAHSMDCSFDGEPVARPPMTSVSCCRSAVIAVSPSSAAMRRSTSDGAARVAAVRPRMMATNAGTARHRGMTIPPRPHTGQGVAMLLEVALPTLFVGRRFRPTAEGA